LGLREKRTASGGGGENCLTEKGNCRRGGKGEMGASYRVLVTKGSYTEEDPVKRPFFLQKVRSARRGGMVRLGCFSTTSGMSYFSKGEGGTLCGRSGPHPAG